MPGKSQGKTTRGFRICCGLALSILASAPRAGVAAGRPPRARPRVKEIRFGLIDPPVIAQRDITVRAATSNQNPEPKPLECSGLAWVDGYLIVSSDRHQHLLFTCAVDLARMTIAEPRPHVIISNEQNLLDDAESVTVRRRPDGSWLVYVMCSLSNDNRQLPLPMRRHMLRLALRPGEPFSFQGVTVLGAGKIRQRVDREFKAVGVQPYRTYYGEHPGADKNTYRWGNVEGIAFTPDASRMLCGMRNPLFGGAALMLAVRGADDALTAADAGRFEVTDVFPLDLDRRGVSDLCWDPVTKGYLIAAAKSNGPKLDDDQPFPPNTLDSALFWWSGHKTDKPVLFATAPDMKVEAVCRLGTSRFIAVGSDEGDVSEGREQRQSVLTIMDFTGVAR